MAKYTVKKLDVSQPGVRQESFRILYSAFNNSSDRRSAADKLPKNPSIFKKLEQTECFGVFQGASQIGFGILRDLKNNTYRISHIAVDPLYRHDGAGGKLVRAMIRSVAARGGGTVLLQTDPGKKNERKWFMSMGFAPAKRGTDDGISLTLTIDEKILFYLDLCDVLDRYPDLVYGFYAVDEDPYCDTYPTALVLMRPYRCSEQENDERYHELLLREKEHLNTVLRSVSNHLNDLGIQNLPMPLHRHDVDESLARKVAAMRAGLGWLGKNDRVVHRVYGSQTVSCRIYLNADLPVNTHIRRNHCGDCRRCVDACPVECLKNKKWSTKIPRKDIIDEAACLEYRSRSYSQTGRYTECDRCVRCCPGKNERKPT
ncbi:MAG: GNAT family N-acetyltransferase [Clostridia bacterium]|nr:GNAT family N-acetyltransferase [Clostridia bacterium]